VTGRSYCYLAAMQKGESASSSTSPVELPKSNERKVVFLLCLLAAIHVFIFSAAFPFFDNVDEQIHFDMVLKYSHGHVPRGVEAISPESATYLALYSSSEYFQQASSHFPPPPWTLPEDQMRQMVGANLAYWQKQNDYEVSQAPLYYTLAGCWWHVGKWLGFSGGHLLYWLRFLNVAIIVVVVWLGYFASRLIFPENTFLKLGVPAMLVCIPQTTFYSISNDNLSTICFGATFICLLKWLNTPTPCAWLGAITGLGFAATWLAKISNLPALFVALIALMVKSTWPPGRLRSTWPAWLAFLGCALPAVVGWSLWSRANYGDFTGSKLNREYFGWTIKPLSGWWHHPIFTPSGFWTYLSEEFGTFWQGEFVWHYQKLVLPGSYFLYTTLSLVLMLAVGVTLAGRFRDLTIRQRGALLLSLACFVAGFGFFGLLSTIYDFHNWPAPSRAHPYIICGRYLLDALIPFLLLFVYGLDCLLGRFGSVAKFLTLAVIISAIIASEIVTDWPVFSSPYNWFHLP
jgi:hypothetical protein